MGLGQVVCWKVNKWGLKSRAQEWVEGAKGVIQVRDGLRVGLECGGCWKTKPTWWGGGNQSF